MNNDTIRIEDIGPEFDLVQNEDEVIATSEDLNVTVENYDYLFVQIEDGEIIKAYGSYSVDINRNAYLIR